MLMDENAELARPCFYVSVETAEGYELKSFGNGTKPEFSNGQRNGTMFGLYGFR